MAEFKIEQAFNVPSVFPDPVSTDPLMEARHIWKKGRFEFMGGPTMFIQDGSNNNERDCKYPPSLSNQDPVAHDLGVDATEQ